MKEELELKAYVEGYSDEISRVIKIINEESTKAYYDVNTHVNEKCTIAKITEKIYRILKKGNINKFSVGDIVEYIGTESTLWRKKGIVQRHLEHNSKYNYDVFIIDFEEEINVVIPDVFLNKITPKTYS